MGRRSQPYRVQWPLSPEQVEGIDEMFQILFDDLGLIERAPGLQGLTGETGPRGPEGFEGDEGSIGLPGAPGEAGSPGPRGPMGPVGDDGDDGMPGVPGVAGGVGSAGPIGPPGQDGDDGRDPWWIPAAAAAAAGTGTVDTTGTPANNQIAVFTDADTIEGDSAFTYDGTTLTIPGQIAFPATQVASAGANTLDDYEEGTWTPVDNSGAALTFTSVDANYVKIGKVVYLRWELKYPSTADVSAASIGGLPFALAAGGFSAGSPGFVNAAVPIYFYFNVSSIDPLTQAGGNNLTNAQASLAFMWGAGYYFV